VHCAKRGAEQRINGTRIIFKRGGRDKKNMAPTQLVFALTPCTLKTQA
jgi:hypothetical protein